MAKQKSTTIRLKTEHYKLLKDLAEKNNRNMSGQLNWLLEIAWHLEETRNQIFNEIISELTEPEYSLASVKIRRK